jgi:hypothetical protein
MHGATLNPALIRTLLIVLFVVITQIMRAAKMSKTAKPGTAKPGATAKPDARSGAGTGMQLGDALREAMRQRAEQARARQSEQPVQAVRSEAEPLAFDEPFQQPPKIEPDSSIVPSLLLLALLACLCLMAYRYWAG